MAEADAILQLAKAVSALATAVSAGFGTLNFILFLFLIFKNMGGNK